MNVNSKWRLPLRGRDLEQKRFRGEFTARVRERSQSSCTAKPGSLDSISGSDTPRVRGARWALSTCVCWLACLSGISAQASSALPHTTFQAKWAVLLNMTLTHATAGGKSKIDWAHGKGIYYWVRFFVCVVFFFLSFFFMTTRCLENLSETFFIKISFIKVFEGFLS